MIILLRSVLVCESLLLGANYMQEKQTIPRRSKTIKQEVDLFTHMKYNLME